MGMESALRRHSHLGANLSKFDANSTMVLGG